MQRACVYLGLLAVWSFCRGAVSADSTTLDLPSDWGPDVARVAIHGTYFGMTREAVSNQHARYKPAPKPTSELDAQSYVVLAVPEDRLGIGQARPNVIVTCVKTIYFNQEGRVVAIEMVFAPLDNDKRVHLLDQLERRYTAQPVTRKNFYRYTVSDNIQLETTVKPTAFQSSIFAGDTPVEFTVRNFYTYRPKYREALERSTRVPLLDGLL
ncbi:MAG: hypothetical protein N2595_07085 [bacterium]|nr:hypothetical protein [bacterium]